MSAGMSDGKSGRDRNVKGRRTISLQRLGMPVVQGAQVLDFHGCVQSC